jgi:NAD(P)-dependent dehydrogenase (short-subunit alcohol dehydrogenase family)
MRDWTAADIPKQAGRQAVVTGGSGGLGFEIALALAQAGTDVVLAGRDRVLARAALAEIRPLAPGVLVRFESLDLANLASVADFAERLIARNYPIDILVNNAGLRSMGERRLTVDGFEVHLGTNYLGHFALTARLLPLLRRSRHARVVQVSSLAHRQGRIDFDDLHLERGYKPGRAYSQSKLAKLIFALELQRRSNAQGWGLRSAAAHPGNPCNERPGKSLGYKGEIPGVGRILRPFLSHSAAEGALPALFAVTSPEAQPGGFYGPSGRFEMAGAPGPARVDEKAQDLAVARKLWEISEELTSIKWPRG